MITAYAAHRHARPSTASRATACWPAPRNWASTRIARAFWNWNARRARRCPAACRTASSRSITSRITHRPDLWGHHGMAREVAAILGQTAARSDPAGSDAATRRRRCEIEIADLDLCPRYSALVFENVTVQPSPLWLQYRLTAIGLNPINNIVDLTNYIMAEIAQPMHAFDRDLLRGSTIWARPATAGESIRGAERRALRSEPVEPGDRRCRRPHRDRRRDRRAGERDLGQDHQHRAGEREFPGGQRPQDLVGAEAAHRCLHALRESAGSGEYGARPGARGGAAAGAFAGRPAGGRPGRSDAAHRCRRRRSRCRSTG